MWIVLAALSAVCYGSADFCGGLAARGARLLPVLIISQGAGLLVVAVAAPLVGPGPPLWVDLAWGAAAGLAGVAGLAVFYRALATKPMAIVSPAAAVAGAALPLVFGLVLGERPTVFGWAGLPLGGAAILALSLQRPREGARSTARAALGLGLVSGLGFGGFFILLSRTGSGSGLWPLLAARCASVASMAAVCVAQRKAPGLPRSSVPATLAAGTLDMAANLLYLLGTRVGLVSLVAVVVSLYAAPTVVLARVFLGEKLTPMRWAGVGLALAAVGGMSLGSP